jgi:hypothetical protein
VRSRPRGMCAVRISHGHQVVPAVGGLHEPRILLVVQAHEAAHVRVVVSSHRGELSRPHLASPNVLRLTLLFIIIIIFFFLVVAAIVAQVGTAPVEAAQQRLAVRLLHGGRRQCVRGVTTAASSALVPPTRRAHARATRTATSLIGCRMLPSTSACCIASKKAWSAPPRMHRRTADGVASPSSCTNIPTR